MAGILLLTRSKNQAPTEDALLSGAPAHSAAAANGPKGGTLGSEPAKFANRTGPGRDTADTAGAGSREIAERRLERARHTLEGYRQATRYPPSARPLAEKPDLQRPHAVQGSTLPLSRPDHEATDARVTLSQDRLYLVGDEAARLQISCATSKGPAKCEITRALAHVHETMTNAPAIAPARVEFASAEDPSTMIGTFTPANAGFGGYHGPIAIDLALRIGPEEGGARFDLVYTPAAPAKFTGAVREALENGSVCLYLQMTVDKPGRYLLSARVDDADGDGFAFLDYNEIVGAGTQEAKMCIFGKLVLDERARSPFLLRDLEGYLLKEDTYPDRELMAAREGPVFTTKAYPESAFSDAEWQSEERTRHLEEFEKDVKEAEEGLEAAGTP